MSKRKKFIRNLNLLIGIPFFVYFILIAFIFPNPILFLISLIITLPSMFFLILMVNKYIKSQATETLIMGNQTEFSFDVNDDYDELLIDVIWSVSTDWKIKVISFLHTLSVELDGQKLNTYETFASSAGMSLTGEAEYHFSFYRKTEDQFTILNPKKGKYYFVSNQNTAPTGVKIWIEVRLYK